MTERFNKIYAMLNNPNYFNTVFLTKYQKIMKESFKKDLPVQEAAVFSTAYQIGYSSGVYFNVTEDEHKIKIKPADFVITNDL